MVSKKMASHWTMPVYFQKTRFYDYTTDMDHDEEMLALILSKGLPVKQLLWSPYSTLAWALASYINIREGGR